MSQKTKIEIFVDLNRTGHDKLLKKISVLAQLNIYGVMADLRIT